MDAAVKKHVATDVAVIDGVSVSGAFSNEYVEAAGSQGLAPLFRCLVADLGASWTGSTLIYDGTTYRIVVPQPDGAGWVTLILERQS